MEGEEGTRTVLPVTLTALDTAPLRSDSYRFLNAPSLLIPEAISKFMRLSAPSIIRLAVLILLLSANLPTPMDRPFKAPPPTAPVAVNKAALAGSTSPFVAISSKALYPPPKAPPMASAPLIEAPNGIREVGSAIAPVTSPMAFAVPSSESK